LAILANILETLEDRQAHFYYKKLIGSHSHIRLILVSFHDLEWPLNAGREWPYLYKWRFSIRTLWPRAIKFDTL